MARRYTPEKREIFPDARFGRIEIQEMIKSDHAQWQEKHSHPADV